MMHKRTVYSLLLTSFILVFAFSSALAQTVIFESKNAKRCESGVLNITVVPPTGIELNAIEIVFEIKSTSGGAFFDVFNVVFDPGFGVLTNRIIDSSGVDGISPDTIRMAALATDSAAPCLVGSTLVAQVQFKTNNVCGGVISLDGAVYTSPTNPLIVAPTQFVDCRTNALIAAAVIAGGVTVINAPPTIDPIADTTLPWGTTHSSLAVGNDPDLVNGCEKLTYSKLAGSPPGLTVNAVTGAISWNTTGADVCTHTVTIQVKDSCGLTAQTSYDICVTNEAPVIDSCSVPDRVCWSELVSGSVSASDSDGGPAALSYSLLSFTGPGAPIVNASTGDWTWQTLEQNSYIGTFTLCILVTDGANICDPCSPSNADTCCVDIEVIPTYRVTIEKTHKTPLGSFEDVSVFLDNSINPGNPMGGYDFLIQYDPSVLSFNSADPGAMIDTSGDAWEYFEYRHGVNGNCNVGCPTGKLRVLAIAETNNGANHPAGFGETPAASSELTVLHFLVTNDYTHECQFAPISFCWYDCGDNAISSKSGDTLFISRFVYGYGLVGNITADFPFPTLTGANSSCDTLIGDGKPDPERCVDFWSGGIDLVCVDSIDDRGDINLNGIANEVADAVLFSNYFVYGLSVFGPDAAAQIAATDVNADGTVLSVADLVYLIRIVIGDALPFSKFTPMLVPVRYTHDSKGVMSVKDDVLIGAVHVVISGEMKVDPILMANEMEMQFAFNGTNTRVLVWSREGNSFTGDFLNITGNVLSLEMATYEGHPVSLEVLPTEYALNQNYPNPFNPSTVLSFSLPTQSDYTITIFNVNGQQVAVLSGKEAAGVHEVVWEAGSVHASGIYFYRLVAENGTDRYVDTKKMVLLK